MVLILIGGLIGYYGYYMAVSIYWLQQFGYPETHNSYIAIMWIGGFIAVIGLIISIVGVALEKKTHSMIQSQQPIPNSYQAYSPVNQYCPNCRSQLYWADQYRSYYCARCRVLLPPESSYADRMANSLEKELKK